MLRLFTLILLALVAPPAGAQRAMGWMDDGQIRQAFDGVTIDGIYADGITFTETYAANGGVDYRDTRRSMTGRWSVVNRSFCTHYDGGVSGGCFWVVRHSGNCFEFYFLSSSEAEAAKVEPTRPNWTARGWNKSQPATCDEKPVV